MRRTYATYAAGVFTITAAAYPSYIVRHQHVGASARPANDHRIATWVSLDENYSDVGGNPIIVRAPAALRPDVIMVNQNTTPAQLATAAMQLSRIREETGDVAVAATTFRVMAGPKHTRPSGEDRVASRVLVNLRSAAYRDITGLGRARVIEVYLPDATLRDHLHKSGRMGFVRRP